MDNTDKTQKIINDTDDIQEITPNIPEWEITQYMTEKFGYNPGFNIKDYGNKKIQTGTGVIIAHGFGSSSSSYNSFIKTLKNQKKNPIKFNFKDANQKSFRKIFVTDLGGLKEATIVLYPIVKLFEKGCKNFVLFGHSRGAAAVIQALYIIANPNQKYKSYSDNLSFESNLKKTDLWDQKNNKPNQNKINNIEKSIKKVFIANPLLSIKKVTKKISTEIIKDFIEKKISSAFVKTKSVLKYLQNPFATSSAYASDIGLSSISKVPYFRTEPIELLKNENMQKFSIDFSLAKKDEIVGNALDKELKVLVSKNQKWTATNENSKHGDIQISLEKLKNHH